ncbi:MAG: SLBB domain-containing protein [Actinobacteria bacterium]|nr:SLBB domain-containing protein [Actinomycetota bacterium]
MAFAELHRTLDPEPVTTLDDHVGAGGGRGLAVVSDAGGDAVLAVLEASGLRGRGGAGFPTATKWRTVLGQRAGPPPTVVVNGAEGEPGSFKDRMILRRNPYRVIEGALVAARVAGADEVVVALKASSTVERARVRAAMDEITAAGWADGVALRVAEGPTAYLFGEETALLEVLDGRPPFPRVAPPWRRGVDDVGDRPDEAAGSHLGGVDSPTDVPPALVNNVETMANVALIAAEGADWFRSAGTASSPGTIVVTVSGDVERSGVVEVAMGTPLREVIEAVGFPTERRRILAVLSGVSAPVLPASALDTPLTHEDLRAAGSGLGATGYIVVDDSRDMAAVAAGVSRFLAIESCGQCMPCKADGLEVAGRLEAIIGGRADTTALPVIVERLDGIEYGARCSLASQHRAVVGSLLDAFPGVVEGHLDRRLEPVEPFPVAEIVDLTDDGVAVLDDRQLRKQPDWTYGDTWTGAFPAALA